MKKNKSKAIHKLLYTSLSLILIFTLSPLKSEATIFSVNDFLTKNEGDSLSATEFNEVIGTLKGITRDDNNTIGDFSDDKWGFGVASPSSRIDFAGDVTATNYYGSGENLSGLPWTKTPTHIYTLNRAGVGSSTLAQDLVHLNTASGYPDATALRIEGDYPAIRIQEKDQAPNGNWELTAFNQDLYITKANNDYSSLDVIMTFLPNGNVGIGNASPDQKLKVNGNIYVSSSSDICIDGGNCLSSVSNGGNSENGNIYWGNNSGADSTNEAENNTAIGNSSLENNQSGDENVVIGYMAANGKDNGSEIIDRAVILGAYAGDDLKTSHENILIGHSAGSLIQNGSRNIVIGANQEVAQKNGNDQLNIAGIIHGDLSSGRIGINEDSPSYTLDVDGTIRGDNVSPSDASLKTNIQNLDSPKILEKVLKLEGKKYNWKKTPEANPEYGFIAQEVEVIFPEVVSTDDEGIKSLNYQKMIPLLLEAIKAQQAEIELLKS